MKLWDRLIYWWYRKEFDQTYIYEHEVSPTPENIVKRVKLLFKLHGIEEAEIPEVYPEISLHDLQSDSNLLQKLNPQFLKKLSDFFQIRIEWLRSGEPYLFNTRHWYKGQTLNFFQDLKDADFEKDYDPFEVISTKEKFDVYNADYQPFILVIKVPIANIDDRIIYRYMLESKWDWHHDTCRLGAKAIATKYYQLTERMIPIYTVSKDDFKKLSARLITPYLDKSLNHNVSFEEYGALDTLHIEPNENDEYEAIVNNIKDKKLDQFFYDYINTKCQNSNEKTSSNLKGKVESHFKRAAYARHEKTYQLKRDCILFWIELPKPISNVEAARRFIKSNSKEKMTTHAPTNLESLLSEAISEYLKKDEILANKGELPNWMKGFSPN